MNPSEQVGKLVLYLVFLYIFFCTILINITKQFYLFQPEHVEDHAEDKNEIFLRNSTSEVFPNEVFLNEESKKLQKSILGVCKKYNLTTPIVRNHFLYSEDHRLLYCWIRKVASTSFTKFFSDLRHRQFMKDYYKEINSLVPETSELLDNVLKNRNVTKFLVVRHPFDRIVSAYRDRIEDNSKYTSQAFIYVPKIFHLTRPTLFHSNTSSSSWMDMIFHPNKRLKLVPSFEEFIKWILSESSEHEDPHWSLFYKHCSVCRVDYNIVKLESLSFGMKGWHILENLEATKNGVTNFKRSCDYFQNLSRLDIYRLYKRYRMDFQLFGYEHQKYLNCSKK